MALSLNREQAQYQRSFWRPQPRSLPWQKIREMFMIFTCFLTVRSWICFCFCFSSVREGFCFAVCSRQPRTWPGCSDPLNGFDKFWETYCSRVSGKKNTLKRTSMKDRLSCGAWPALKLSPPKIRMALSHCLDHRAIPFPAPYGYPGYCRRSCKQKSRSWYAARCITAGSNPGNGKSSTCRCWSIHT